MDLTTLGTWSITPPDGVTATIDPATGVVTITDMTVSEAIIPVTFVYGDISRPGEIHVKREDAPPTAPNSGGNTGGGSGTPSGTVASTSALANTAGTAYVAGAASAVMSLVAGAAGKIQCKAPVSFMRVQRSLEGETGAAGKWQWRVPGGTWADIAGQGTSGVNAKTLYDAERNTYTNRQGSMSVSQTKTGLTPGATYEVQFLWRRVDVSGDASELYLLSGVLTADGTVT